MTSTPFARGECRIPSLRSSLLHEHSFTSDICTGGAPCNTPEGYSRLHRDVPANRLNGAVNVVGPNRSTALCDSYIYGIWVRPILAVSGFT